MAAGNNQKQQRKCVNINSNLAKIMAAEYGGENGWLIMENGGENVIENMA
jgi:hypothetical protein